MARINLSGMGVALITPFKEDESIDFDAFARLLDYQIQNGTDYLVVLGTTAETPTLSEDEKDTCRRIEHMRWNRFHLLNNWQYAETRNNAMRQHPLIRPFDSLSEFDREKDDYAWNLLEEAGHIV